LFQIRKKSDEGAIPPERRRIFPLFLAAALLPSAGSVHALDRQGGLTPGEIKQMTLEELMEIEVTLVSRQPERISYAASAIQVITAEDIRRSGAATLSEALRLASNLQVARVDARQWAITARGLNEALANKLLVMIDGRTVYTPLYAGVFWDVQHLILDNIERIEVVSGPGGTLWGTNAVNGVINIVTKEAERTQGLYLEGGAGTLVRDFAAARYGGRAGDRGHYRVYGQRIDHRASELSGGGEGGDAWNLTRGGMRMDWDLGKSGSLTVQGDIQAGEMEQNTPGSGAIRADGQFLQARWSRDLEGGSHVQAKAYFDRTWRDIPGIFEEELRTWDFDFSHRLPLGERNTLTWGAGYRYMQDDVENGPVLAFLPARKDLQLASAFLQDEIVLIPGRLRLAVGSKFEHNDYSEFEVMPSARMAWTPAPDHTVWGAVSRAVRSPSRVDVDFFIPSFGGDTALDFQGGPAFDSEKLMAFEVGYRVRPFKAATLSLAGFVNRYDGLRSLELAEPGVLQLLNGIEGEIYGLELSGHLQALSWWRLRGGYTFLHHELRVAPGHDEFRESGSMGNDPGYQLLVQSYMDLPGQFEINGSARLVDELPAPHVPGYFALELGAAWRHRGLEVSLTGKNLTDGRHPEFGAAPRRHEIPRSVRGRVAWRW
jgi:iron complex outermembrane receptor protein